MPEGNGGEMIKTTGAKVGDWIIAAICFFLILICLLPVLNILSRSLSDPLALVRNEVLLLPQTYDRDTAFNYIYNEDGSKMLVTAVIENTFDNRTQSVVSETFIVKEVTEGGVTETVYVPLNEEFDPLLFGKVEVSLDTGIEVDSVEVGDTTFINDFDEETLTGTIIVEDVEVRQVSSDNASKLGVDFTAYTEILKDSRYTWSLAWTAMLTVGCAIFSVLMTAICAYPLTYDNLKGRKFFNTMIILTMYFSAGTIPTYLLLKNLNLINHPLVLVLPFCLSVFNMIIMRSYFYGIPLSLRESAELDGAGPVRTMISIYLPLSMPVIATLLLFYAVGRWNGYSDAMMFMNQNRFFYPIQYLLFNMMNNSMSPDVMLSDPDTMLGRGESMRMAMVMFAMVPIICVYPFLQRYFIAGVTLGAVKE